MGIKLSSGQPQPFGPPPSGQPASSAGMPQREPFMQKALRWSRVALTLITILYVLCVVVIVCLIEFDAEDHHLSSILMYMPQYIWLFPLFILTPICLLVYSRLVIAHLLVIGFVLFWFMDYVRKGPRTPGGPTFTIMTNNIGQNHGKSIKPFVEAEQPDIIVLQDAGRRGPEYQKMFPDRYLRGEDQFLVISRFPILNGGVLPLVDLEERPVAAWFEVDINGFEIYVFALHMPTPRDQLNAIKGTGLLGTFTSRMGKEGHATKVYKEGKAFFAYQLELANKMIEFTKEADKPYVVCGDFNIPTHGKTYHAYKRAWVEVFAEVGEGYGYTFPGDAKISKIFGPWLRLDNIYCSRNLLPISAKAEKGRGSQHLAMVATLELPRKRIE